MTETVEEVEFPSQGTTLRAGHFLPAQERLKNARGTPCVVMAHGLGGTGEIQLKTLGDLIAGAGRIGSHAAFPLGLIHNPLLGLPGGRHAEFGQLLQHRQTLLDPSPECAMRTGFRLIRGGITRGRVGKGGGEVRAHIGYDRNI